MKLDYTITSLHEGIRKLCLKSYQYWLVFKGSGELSQKGETRILISAGDLLEIPAKYAFQLDNKTEISIGCITLSDFRITNTALKHYPNSYSISLVRQSFLYALQMTAEPLPNVERFHSNMDQILLDLLMNATIPGPDRDKPVFGFIRQMRLHYKEPDFNIGNAIRTTGFSESYIRKVFKKEVGITPLEFLNNLRIDHAKALMREKPISYSVRRAALESGFQGPYYFSRLFRKKTGMTPSEFLEKGRKSLSIDQVNSTHQ